MISVLAPIGERMVVKASEPSLLKALEAREVRYCDRYGLSYKFCSASSTVRRLECQGSLKGHYGCVNTVSFSSDGQIALTGSDDCKLMLHDVESLKRLSSVHSGHDHKCVFPFLALIRVSFYDLCLSNSPL